MIHSWGWSVWELVYCHNGIRSTISWDPIQRSIERVVDLWRWAFESGNHHSDRKGHGIVMISLLILFSDWLSQGTEARPLLMPITEGYRAVV